MAGPLERLGVMPTYTSFRGDVVHPPEASLEAVRDSMKGDRPRRIASHRREGDPIRCAPPPRRAWG